MEATGSDLREPSFRQVPTHPVVGVSWNDAKKFCEWLTGREQSSGVGGNVRQWCEDYYAERKYSELSAFRPPSGRRLDSAPTGARFVC